MNKRRNNSSKPFVFNIDIALILRAYLEYELPYTIVRRQFVARRVVVRGWERIA